jgi:hypothetical protein
MKFVLNVGNKHYFCKKKIKIGSKLFLLVSFKTIQQMKCSITILNHTSYFLNMKYIQALQHLNHTEC